MLTILHPQLMPTIRQMPGGLLPFDLPGEDRPSLIMKVPKEYILAAKINASFKIYITPVLVEGRMTCGLATAFFDDTDEPLVLRTPLFNDDFKNVLLGVLERELIDVHFFDELSRELLVYRATVFIPEASRQRLAKTAWIEPSNAVARTILDGIDTYFGLRTQRDDNEAIVVSLNESIYGEDLLIQDLRPNNHEYHGSRGFSQTMLERKEPGRFQEEDIVQCLQMTFPPSQIYLSPKRGYDGEEICDILVMTDTRALIIQAKDSPNVERISRQKLSRKRASILGALSKAIEQIKGAIGYFRRQPDTVEIVVAGVTRSFDLRSRQLKSLIVVKELFGDQFKDYSTLLLGLVHEKGVDCIALDYPELFKYCAHLEDETGFFEAYDRVVAFAREHGEYPRLRFGVSDDS